jgi:hypothetical protein
MDNSPEHVGRLVALVLGACLALYFLVRGLSPAPRSRRLANLALFCGLTTFVMPEVALGLLSPERPGLYFLSGTVRLLTGLTGVALAVAALASRRRDGTGAGRPLAGLAFSLLHGLAGSGFLLYGWMASPSTPWVYQSPDGSFRLTLPSRQWKETPPPSGKGVVGFVRAIPRMQAGVVRVKRPATRDEFRQAAEAFRAYLEANPRQRGQAKSRDGTTAAGNAYAYVTLMDADSEGSPVFVAHSVVWSPTKEMLVEVVFEGLPAMRSESGRATEMAAFEKAAETICLSVE